MFPGRPLFVLGTYFLHDVGVYLVGHTELLVKGGLAEFVLPNLQLNLRPRVTLHKFPRTNNMRPYTFLTQPHPILGDFFQNRYRHIGGSI